MAFLSDPLVGRALSALHEDPARGWTVEALAELAGLSRSAFAARFADAVGQTPLKYLAAWRPRLQGPVRRLAGRIPAPGGQAHRL